MSAYIGVARHPDHMDARLLGIVGACRTLCLNVANPGWDDARGYLFDPVTNTLYFPVSRKYLDGRDLSRYSVLIWSQPRVLAVGRLTPATSASDIDTVQHLAAAGGLDPAKIDRLLFDQRHHNPRKNRHKLELQALEECAP